MKWYPKIWSFQVPNPLESMGQLKPHLGGIVDSAERLIDSWDLLVEHIKKTTTGEKEKAEWTHMIALVERCCLILFLAVLVLLTVLLIWHKWY